MEMDGAGRRPGVGETAGRSPGGRVAGNGRTPRGVSESPGEDMDGR